MSHHISQYCFVTILPDKVGKIFKNCLLHWIASKFVVRLSDFYAVSRKSTESSYVFSEYYFIAVCLSLINIANR